MTTEQNSTTILPRHADLHVDELLRELNVSADDEISLRHPMTFGEVVGRARIEALAAATASVFSRVEPQHVWLGDGIGGREWHGHFGERVIRGVTVVRRDGAQVRIDIFLGSFPAPLREALWERGRGLIEADAWVVPPGIDTALPPVPADETLDAKLPFALTDDMMLTSPVACKPIRGLADVERVCGHSIAVYGGRASGPRLSAGATTLSLWTGEVCGMPLEVANVIHWADPQHVKVMAMAMRPWPVVAQFQARMQARTLPFLDASYFESDADGVAAAMHSDEA